MHYLINIFKYLILFLALWTGWGVHALTGEEAVRRFFQYFQVDKPVGIPVVNFDEPAQLLTPLIMVPVSLINGTVLGHSQITIVNVVVNLMTMKGSTKVTAPRLEIEGQYEWPGLFVTSKGHMNSTITEAMIEVDFFMLVDQNGTLQLSDIQMELDYHDVFINMTELSWEQDLIISSGSVRVFFYDFVQEIFRQAQTTLTDRVAISISTREAKHLLIHQPKGLVSKQTLNFTCLLKPLILRNLNNEISKFVATLPAAVKVDGIDDTNPKTLHYFLQRLFRYMGLEPLRLPERRSKMLGVSFKISDLVLNGLSVVNDIKSLMLIYLDQKLYMESTMTYPKLLMHYTLGIDSGSVLDFDIYEKSQLNNVEIRFKIVIDPKQKLPPQLRDLNVDIESFGLVKSGREGGFFHSISFFFSNMGDSIRSEIISALSGVLRKIIQSDLNKVNLEKELLGFLESKGMV